MMAEREEQAEWVVERKRTQSILPFPDEEDLWEQGGQLGSAQELQQGDEGAWR